MYGRGISRPRVFSSLSGATSALTGQRLFRAQSAQVKATLFVQKRCQIDSNKLPRKAAPLCSSSSIGVTTSVVNWN